MQSLNKKVNKNFNDIMFQPNYDAEYDDRLRILNKGKSFQFTKWKPAVEYFNDIMTQDFVEYKNKWYICKINHLSDKNNSPDKNDNCWELVLRIESLYTQAVENGYTGTEKEFYDDLNKILNTSFDFNSKVDKEEGKGLIELDEIERLKKLPLNKSVGDFSLQQDSTIALGNFANAFGNKSYAIGNSSHSEGSDFISILDNIYFEENNLENFEYTIISKTNQDIQSYLDNNDILEFDNLFYKILNINIDLETNKILITFDKLIDSPKKIRQINILKGAYGNSSHAEGKGTIIKEDNAHVEGQFNKNIVNAIHIVGIGSSDSDRQNAYVITKDGRHYIKNIGKYTGIESDLNQAEDLATIVNSKVDKSEVDGLVNESLIWNELEEI